MNRRLAMTTDGKLTWCTADDERIGKGRCNHIAHQNSDETSEDFCNRMEFIFEKRENVPDVAVSIDKFKNHIAGALTKFRHDDFYYKIDSDSEMFEQRNALSEEMACLVESEISGFDYVDYSVVSLQEKDNKAVIACKSKNFLKPGEAFKTINEAINFGDEFLIDDLDYEPIDRSAQLEVVVNELHSRTGFDKTYIRETILRQISLDFLIMNNDRTLNNIGLIYDENTGKAVRMASCFDNGSCITAYKEYDEASFDEIEEEFSICTFGTGDNQDYLDMIAEYGGPLLKLNSKVLIAKIKAYECKAYPKYIVERNKGILIRNLEKYKGILYCEE